jgi:hypothetical protein
MYVTTCLLPAAQCSQGDFIQVESGRIIIDPHAFNIYGMPGPNLESIESTPPTDLADGNLLGKIHSVIFKATSQAFREYKRALEKHEKHQRSDLSPRRKPASHLFTH